LKIVIVHNRYALPGRGSGEEVAIDTISRLLEEKGHLVIPYMRSSLEVQEMKFGKARGLFSGIYNIKAKREMKSLLEQEEPDFVLAQNVYPFISPAVLVACREGNVPVIMRCPNYRLICPNGLFMTKGEICERCAGGKEYWCILKNCEDNVFKSIGYALRTFVARRFSLFKNNVDVFMVLTEFAKRKLVENGFPSKRVHVIYGLADMNQIESPLNQSNRSYVGFVGRIKSEKGIDTLLKASKYLPEIPFKIAGGYDGYFNLVQQTPRNVEFLGQLNRKALDEFYVGARIIVAPSRWYEGLPMAIIEAMLYGKPVICSNLGGLPEVVDDGITGLLFRSDDVEDLVTKIKGLWSSQTLAVEMGMAARRRAEEYYNPSTFYERLMLAYEIAIKSRAC
jgi:glycosyltransferase involved in cell wall biosynthesis